MGMFDYITCKYQLLIPGANDLEYQTKDTDSQSMDRYEIRWDGTLWHELYEIEDHSEMAKWKAANPGKEPPNELANDPLSSFVGCMARVNQYWVKVENFTGEIRFYEKCHVDSNNIVKSGGDAWIEWSAYFVNGKLNQVNLIQSPLPSM